MSCFLLESPTDLELERTIVVHLMSGKRKKFAVKLCTHGYKVVLPNADKTIYPELLWELWLNTRTHIALPLQQYGTLLNPNSTSFENDLSDICNTNGIAIIDSSRTVALLACQ